MYKKSTNFFYDGTLLSVKLKCVMEWAGIKEDDLADWGNRWFFSAPFLVVMLESNCMATFDVDSWSLWNRLFGSKM